MEKWFWATDGQAYVWFFRKVHVDLILIMLHNYAKLQSNRMRGLRVYNEHTHKHTNTQTNRISDMGFYYIVLDVSPSKMTGPVYFIQKYKIFLKSCTLLPKNVAVSIWFMIFWECLFYEFNVTSVFKLSVSNRLRTCVLSLSSLFI